MLRSCWLLACLLFIASCGPPPKPSVLLVTIDTLRADALGAYGARPSHSPNLDVLAAQSTLYESAHTTMPMTRPAHFSIFTSRYPREHGVLNNLLSLPLAEQTLAETFQANGYRTGAFVSVPLLAWDSGAEQGFEILKAPAREKPNAVDSALEWLGALGSSDPFFAWVHVFYPHQPYQQLDPKLGKVNAAMLRRFPKLQWPDFYKVAADHQGNIPRAVFQHALALYLAEVAFADGQIGRLLNGLKKLRDIDNVIVVVTSDHGECFENGTFFEHSDCMQQASLQVPLLIRHPGSFAAGFRSNAVVSLIDIAPTLLEAAGIEIPESFNGVPLQRTEALQEERHVLIQYPFYQQEAVVNRFKARRVIETVAGMPFVPAMIDQEQVGIINSDWKYLRNGSREELYRLGDEGDDSHNWVSEQERVREKIAEALDTMLERHPLVILDTGEINDELRATLEALGYIQ